jgi:Integrase core domain
LRLKMAERKAVTAATRGRYQRASKKDKGKMLDEFIELTGYHRVYARSVLRTVERKIVREQQRRAPRSATVKSRKVYDQQVLVVLRQLWVMLDYICGKRLVGIMPEVLGRLEYFGELKVEPEIRAKLLRISAATIDRLLRAERRKQELRGRARTKPGTLLKKQIPLRTFSEWNEQRPGFVEIDLVAHDGGLSAGEYLYTLDMTDVYSGWTEVQAVQNKAQVWVFAALKELRARLPFPLQGIDSDNGSEFINADLLEYCQQERLTFTRSRPYRKNDNCYVEQKNYTMVRRHVGYQRLAGPQQLALVNELYEQLRLYANYFQPLMKLKCKERHGSQVKKKYDLAQTPYQRLQQSPYLSAASKRRLKAEYARLNPAELKRQIERLQAKLLKWAPATRPRRLFRRPESPWINHNYVFGERKAGEDF